MFFLVFSFYNLQATIVISSFSGTQTENLVILEWETTTEENTAHFLVQRSEDCLTWETIASVDAAGFSNEKQFYSFEDTLLTSSECFYYRLEIVSMNEDDSLFSDIVPVTLKQVQEATADVPVLYVDLSGKIFTVLEEAPPGIYVVVTGEKCTKIYYSKN